MTDFTAQINAGIKLLDSEVPNWRGKIDIDELDLGSCSVCVLGQVFGDYDDGIEALGVSGYDYGFNTMSDMSGLTAAWKEALGKNNTLVEKGDIYKDQYGYAVKVLQTALVKISGTETVSSYIVQTGIMRGGKFSGDTGWGGDKPSLTVLTREAFEKEGSYPTKVEQFKPVAGTFITAGGKNYFVYSELELRELKDGAKVVQTANVDLTGAKEMKTFTGIAFASTIKSYI